MMQLYLQRSVGCVRGLAVVCPRLGGYILFVGKLFFGLFVI